jgi:hypothetical protein
MCADRQIGIVGGWRYLIRERNRDGLFAIVRQDVSRDILEDEIALVWSSEVGEVMVAALVAHERRKKWPDADI